MEKDIVTSLADRHEIFGDADAANLGALGIPKIFQSDSYFFWWVDDIFQNLRNRIICGYIHNFVGYSKVIHNIPKSSKHITHIDPGLMSGT